jgi:hypothetical protein
VYASHSNVIFNGADVDANAPFWFVCIGKWSDPFSQRAAGRCILSVIFFVILNLKQLKTGAKL